MCFSQERKKIYCDMPLFKYNEPMVGNSALTESWIRFSLWVWNLWTLWDKQWFSDAYFKASKGNEVK